MKILLVNPRRYTGLDRDYNDGRYNVKNRRIYQFPPTPLLYLSSLIPSTDEIQIVDECIEDFDLDTQCDLVGITAVTWQASRAYHLADELRKRGRLVILGGVHPTFMPEDAKKHADAVVIGEAEALFPQVVEDARNGQLKPYYKADDFPLLDNSNLPKFNLVKFKHYRGRTLQTSRGCPYTCDFCSVRKFNGPKVRFKSPDTVIKEIELLQKAQKEQNSYSGRIFVVDDNFAISKKRAKELLKRIIKYANESDLPLQNWITQTSMDVAKDDELLELFWEAGCRTFFVGLESINQNTLDRYKKAVNKAAEYNIMIEKLRSYNFRILPSFVIGSDDEDTSSFETLVDFVKENKFDYALINILTPYPGTDLFKRYQKENRMLHYDWSKYDIKHVVFRPNKMSPIELQQGFLWIYEELLKWPNIYQFTTEEFARTHHKGLSHRTLSKIKFSPFLLKEWSSHRGRLGGVKYFLKLLLNPEVHGIDFFYICDRLDFLKALRKETETYIRNTLKPKPGLPEISS